MPASVIAAARPVIATKRILWEIADVVEQLYTLAFTENLDPDPEDRSAALDYQAEHGLSPRQMELQLRQYGTSRAVEERAGVVKLIRIDAGRWRVWDYEGFILHNGVGWAPRCVTPVTCPTAVWANTTLSYPLTTN